MNSDLVHGNRESGTTVEIMNEVKSSVFSLYSTYGSLQETLSIALHTNQGIKMIVNIMQNQFPRMIPAP